MAKVNSIRFRKILEDPANVQAVKTLEALGFHEPLNMGEEDFEKIIDEVMSGIPADFPKFIGRADFLKSQNAPKRFCVRISDRLEALRFLFSQAKKGDVVLLCGKGSDVTMMTDVGQIPWNEREIAKRELDMFLEHP